MGQGMQVVNSSAILEAIEGATIVNGRVDDGEGLILELQDGRCLIVAGAFVLSLMRMDTDKLH